MSDLAVPRLTPETARELTEQWTRLYSADGMDLETILEVVRGVLVEWAAGNANLKEPQTKRPGG
jgi:hypothetical protein